MEKIIFGAKEIEVSCLFNNNNVLEIYVNNGDIISLEESFSNSADLEKIILVDKDGNEMRAFKNFLIFKSISKIKGVVTDEINDITGDVIKITLEQEPEWKTETRKLAELQNMNTAGILDLAETLSVIAEGGK